MLVVVLRTWWSQGAGAGTGCAARRQGAGRWAAGRWVLGIPALGAGAGHRELASRCSALVPASDSEVMTAPLLTVKGNKPPLAAVKGDRAPLLTVKCQQSWAA